MARPRLAGGHKTFAQHIRDSGQRKSSRRGATTGNFGCCLAYASEIQTQLPVRWPLGRFKLMSKRWVFLGGVSRLGGPRARRRTTATDNFLAARVEVEQAIRESPDYGPPLCVLGVIDAMLGRKEQAIREGRRARELSPVSKDPYRWCPHNGVYRRHLCLVRRERFAMNR